MKKSFCTTLTFTFQKEMFKFDLRHRPIFTVF